MTEVDLGNRSRVDQFVTKTKEIAHFLYTDIIHPKDQCNTRTLLAYTALDLAAWGFLILESNISTNYHQLGTPENILGQATVGLAALVIPAMGLLSLEFGLIGDIRSLDREISRVSSIANQPHGLDYY